MAGKGVTHELPLDHAPLPREGTHIVHTNRRTSRVPHSAPTCSTALRITSDVFGSGFAARGSVACYYLSGGAAGGEAIAL